MQLDRAHLELLEALADNSTLSAASSHINLSASAASRRLQEASRRIGVRLVETEGRSVRLTAAGRLIADAATDSNRRLAEAELAARWLASGDTVPFRIGVGFYDQVGWLIPPHETVACEVIRSPTARAADTRIQRRVDATIDVVAPGNHDGEVLHHDELVLVVPSAHPLADSRAVAADDLADERYMASNPNPLPGFEFERFFVPGRGGARLIVQVESFSCALDLIARGDGVSIQPRRAIEERAHPGVATATLTKQIKVDWVLEGDDIPAQLMAAMQDGRRSTRSRN